MSNFLVLLGLLVTHWKRLSLAYASSPAFLADVLVSPQPESSNVSQTHEPPHLGLDPGRGARELSLNVRSPNYKSSKTAQNLQTRRFLPKVAGKRRPMVGEGKSC